MDPRIILLGALIFVIEFKLLKSNNFLLAQRKDIYSLQQLMELVLVAWLYILLEKVYPFNLF